MASKRKIKKWKKHDRKAKRWKIRSGTLEDQEKCDLTLFGKSYSRRIRGGYRLTKEEHLRKFNQLKQKAKRLVNHPRNPKNFPQRGDRKE